ncbi:hypothetical protein [Rhizobium sp. RM]|uniref:hypothetical protein n=1 Tax=Rhizobium sp. RM TaxID=2748079 RepID=UPI00110F4B83|nr:hypothetical protein [Rhizobium sp. RM]NWJ26010.1 hypothetical protein [Rhizobium sp. RM]TMV20620.1 hypothetical protein BJG94_07890 [Rhizobium sp. Td3]
MPPCSDDDDVKEGRLEIVLPELSRANIPISLIYPTRKHIAPKVRLFIQHLERSVNKTSL